MSANNQFLGIVQNGQLQLFAPPSVSGNAVRLTSIQMQAAQPPESKELSLTRYEGRALLVSGHDGGGWIYEAKIVDKGGPLLATVVQQVFG
jgi:hypothetical protein